MWKKKLADHYFTILTLDRIKAKVRVSNLTHKIMNVESIVKELQNIDLRWLDEISDVNVAYEYINKRIRQSNFKGLFDGAYTHFRAIPSALNIQFS